MKTTDQATAISKADEWYDHLQFKIDQGLIIKPRSVDQVCDIYIKELEDDVQRGDRPQRHLKDYKTLIEKYVRPYFRQRKMDAIRQKDVDEFIRWRKNYYISGPGSKVKTVTYQRQQRNGIRTITRPAPKPSSTSESALGTLATVLRGIFATAVRHDAVLDANVPSVKISKRNSSTIRSGSTFWGSPGSSLP